MNTMSKGTSAADPVGLPWGGAPDAWRGVPALEAWMAVGAETWRFVADRIQADIAAQHALLHCRNPIDAQVAVIRHLHRTMEDYHRESGRMVELLHQVPGAAAVMDE